MTLPAVVAPYLSRKEVCPCTLPRPLAPVTEVGVQTRAWPPDVVGVAAGDGGGDAGGVEAPGIGVAEAEDGFHVGPLLILRGIDRESLQAESI